MSKLTELLDKYRKAQSLKMKIGILADKTYPDGTKAALVGYLNEFGTKDIPSRPFFRAAIENNRDILPEMAASLVSKHDLEAAARMIGDHMVGEFTRSVNNWSDPPNAQSTIDQKGYNAPLRANDRILRDSFSYEIEQ